MESDEPQRFFLAFFKSIRIPKALFARTARDTYEWGNNGELERITEDHYSQTLYSYHFGEGNDAGKFMQDIEADGIASLYGKSWSEWYIVEESWRKRTRKYSSPDDAKRNQFTILGLLMSVFPDAWSEIAWEEIEAQLWDVAETTCVPFLSVLTTTDIEDYLAYSSRHQQKRQYLISLLKFLLRLSLVLEKRTPPNFKSLICGGICLLRTSELETAGDVSYLELLQSIICILSTNYNQPWAARKELMALKTNSSKRSNAAIGFAFASLPLSWAKSKTEMQWLPNEAPSTIEVIAYALLAGVSSAETISTPSLQTLSLESRVLVAFCEAKRKSFSPAYLLLRESFAELTNSYGRSSMEYLLAGTALVSCCNEGFGGHAAEIIANSVFPSLYGPDGVPVKVEFPQQTFPMVAIADCLLGQSKFDEAREILLRVLEYPLMDFNLSNIAICTELRLLKMSRRQRKAPSDPEDWERLGRVFSQFDVATDSIKYECLEELVSFLSVLKPRDKPPQIFEIVKVVNNYHIEEYKGSADSKKNLVSNIESLQLYKNELNLFTILGPQLHYCRKMRDRFPHATVDFIERIGAANWQRFQRIQGLMEPVNVMDVTVDTAASKFQDSGLGSSLGSELSGNHILGIQQDAKSVVSIRSFMGKEQGATTLQSMPPEDSEGNRICYICQKTLKDVHHESQWKRHAFSDLRPYVCIVEDCKANSVQFASRSEFAAHLTEHQSYKTWRCHANFVRHICHHLEETSLSAIPREEDEFDDDDGEGMSWEENSPGDVDKTEIERAAVEEILQKPQPDPTTKPSKDEWDFAVEEIPEESRPEPVMEHNKYEEGWGASWGASTLTKDKKKKYDKKKSRRVASTDDWLGWQYDYDKGCYVNSRINSDGEMETVDGGQCSPLEAQPVGLEEGLDQFSLFPDEPELEAAETTPRVITPGAGGSKNIEAATEYYARKDIRRDEKKDGRGNETPNNRLATYFVPATGIDMEVIATDIPRYLGSDALVKPGERKNFKGEYIQGYFITAYRAPTTQHRTIHKLHVVLLMDVVETLISTNQGTPNSTSHNSQFLVMRAPDNARPNYAIDQDFLSSLNTPHSAIYSGQPSPSPGPYPGPSNARSEYLTAYGTPKGGYDDDILYDPSEG
ncbi:hypothetical protein VE02_07230 [Pseudogymnoascus sp. 03VT05]|nr:hypothetical protein VE02_07230 [Pseudogymnoascus sp. 03VT05]